MGYGIARNIDEVLVSPESADFSAPLKAQFEKWKQAAQSLAADIETHMDEYPGREEFNRQRFGS